MGNVEADLTEVDGGTYLGGICEDLFRLRSDVSDGGCV
jgi:hypothetical protein